MHGMIEFPFRCTECRVRFQLFSFSEATEVTPKVLEGMSIVGPPFQSLIHDMGI